MVQSTLALFQALAVLSAIGSFFTSVDGAPVGEDCGNFSTSPHVKFHVYPRLSVSQNESQNYDALIPSHPLTMVLHGFGGDINVHSQQTIKEALRLTDVQNVVLVDWAPLANSENWIYNAYTRTCNFGVPTTAKIVSEWLTHIMAKKNITPAQIHLIGFSLGSHVSGMVGNILNSTVGRITALDPPRFGWATRHEDRLDAVDAKFVNVIHSTITFPGSSIPIGHVDFFPNGSPLKPQPGCPEGKNVIHSIVCSHYFAYFVLAESVFNNNAFMAIPCSSWDMFTSGRCNKSTKVAMGYATPNTARGMFYIETNSEPPYGEEDPNNPLPESLMKLLTYQGDEEFSIFSSIWFWSGIVVGIIMLLCCFFFCVGICCA